MFIYKYRLDSSRQCLFSFSLLYWKALFFAFYLGRSSKCEIRNWKTQKKWKYIPLSPFSNVHLLVTSQPGSPWSDNQYKSASPNPSTNFTGVKQHIVYSPKLQVLFFSFSYDENLCTNMVNLGAPCGHQYNVVLMECFHIDSCLSQRSIFAHYISSSFIYLRLW